jgi:hypothetical protein
VGLLSLVSAIEEPHERKSSGSGLESRENGHVDLPRRPRYTPPSARVDTNFSEKRRAVARSL